MYEIMQMVFIVVQISKESTLSDAKYFSTTTIMTFYKLHSGRQGENNNEFIILGERIKCQL